MQRAPHCQGIAHRGIAHRTNAVPSAPLSLGQIVTLVEKRLRWYGFGQWRIRDVLCNQDHTVSVKIQSGGSVILTITLARDGATARYGIHVPQAMRHAFQPALAVSGPPRPVKLVRKPAHLTRTIGAVGHGEPALNRGRAALSAAASNRAARSHIPATG
jgi:hypothetical protein